MTGGNPSSKNWTLEKTFIMLNKPPVIIHGEIKCDWSLLLARSAGNSFFLRKQRDANLFLVVGFFIGLFFLCMAYSGFVQHASSAWVCLIPLFLWLPCLAISLLVYIRNRRLFSTLAGRLIVISVREDGFLIESDKGTTSMKWSDIVHVWKLTKFWFLIYGKEKRCVAIPVEMCRPDLLDIIGKKTMFTKWTRNSY